MIGVILRLSHFVKLDLAGKIEKISGHEKNSSSSYRTVILHYNACKEMNYDNLPYMNGITAPKSKEERSS